MAKVTIYVPDELKARMEAAEHLNWSAAAQRAFEVELNLARWKMVENEEEKVIERLRASKAREDETDRNYGRRCGQKWARNAAEYGELKRVATFQHWNETPEEDCAGTLVRLIMGVDDIREIDRSDKRDLWQQLHDGENEPDPAWIDGFVEGATEVWDEVADKV
jgi:hypothetical protein